MADTAETAQTGRPPKPDESLFKENLGKAEKDHKDVMERYVSPTTTALSVDFLAYADVLG